ncbi:RNA polymerase sigma factor [Clostridium tagluense]|uniref:RNA polymerase sigma factor n=1 Tax=Clostridium tagluense TaxID=360422 RepID=A0A401UPJ7_9CLOT|nr:RNA polymerase sigma factor [Clostridium tagluense]GCD11450.1 DNA-directed RNA polymerase sigma-70 factor [Clostridium tagluense]
MDSQLLLDLYKRQAKIIFGYLIKNGCTKEESEDIIQDSFLKAMQYMDGISKEKLSSWLFTVALNEFRNRIKKHKKQYLLSIDEEEFYNNFTKEEDFTERLLLKERCNEVKNCLNKLKDGNKNLLILKYEMELSYKDIATLLGIKETVVKTYLYRSRKKFEKEWLMHE